MYFLILILGFFKEKNLRDVNKEIAISKLDGLKLNLFSPYF